MLERKNQEKKEEREKYLRKKQTNLIKSKERQN